MKLLSLPIASLNDFLIQDKSMMLVLDSLGHILIKKDGGYSVEVERFPYGAKSRYKKEVVELTSGGAIKNAGIINKTVDKALRNFRDHTRVLDNASYKKELISSRDTMRVPDLMRNPNVFQVINLAGFTCEYYKLDVDLHEIFVLDVDPGTSNYITVEVGDDEIVDVIIKEELNDDEIEDIIVVDPGVVAPKNATVNNVASKIGDTYPETVKPSKLEPVAVPTNLSLEDMISATVRNAVNSNFTGDMLTHVLHNKLNEYGIKPKVKTIEIVNPIKGTTIDVGDLVHKDFEKVLKYASLRMNVFLTGESGSGKTYCASLVAKALDLPIASMSVGGDTGMHEFMGYKDAHGNSVETDFEKSYKNGGVFLVDEIDGGNPNVLLALNQALGSDACTFASGRYDKHEDFVCIAGANTWGFGATADYVGRNPIDGATLNRFVFVYYGYDEDLERKLANNDSWVDTVQTIRANAKKKRVKHIVSPRASLYGAKLLAAGVDKETVLKDVVYQGLSGDEVELIKA